MKSPSRLHLPSASPFGAFRAQSLGGPGLHSGETNLDAQGNRRYHFSSVRYGAHAKIPRRERTASASRRQSCATSSGAVCAARNVNLFTTTSRITPRLATEVIKEGPGC